MTNIYECFKLKEQCKGKGGLFDYPSEGEYSMLVPMSLFGYIEVVRKGLVMRKDMFHYFVNGKVLEDEDNLYLRRNVGLAALKKGQFFDAVFRIDTPFEHREARAATMLEEPKGGIEQNAFDFSNNSVSMDYLRMIFGDVELSPFELGGICRKRTEGDEVYWRMWQESTGRFKQQVNVRGYDEGRLKELFLNAARARPILVGVNRKGDKAISEFIDEIKMNLNSFPLEDNIAIWDYDATCRRVLAVSSFFSRELISIVKTTGEQEREVLEQLRRV